MSEIYLAGGCFWGTQRYLEMIRGVQKTEAGYANGHTENPTYKQVCSEDTGFAETVKVVYDEKQLPLPFLLELFYDAIDPTTVNRQGGDTGPQYRTGIYTVNPADEPVVKASLAKLAEKLGKPVAIEALPLQNYYPAEDYHQDYLVKNPGGYCHIGADKFRKAAAARVNPALYRAEGDAALRERLTDMQYEVTRENATEPPFQNAFWNERRKGIYVDITSGEPLFASTDKFDSGCGWPSFTKPIDPAAVAEKHDASHGMVRTEVRSRVGDSHLGHVFNDGPAEAGGLRYCINSAALRFVPAEEMAREGYGYLLDLIK